MDEIEALKTEIKIVRENKVENDDFEKEIFEIKDMLSKMNSG